MAAIPVKIPRRRRLRKSLRSVLDVAQDPKYIPGKLPPAPGNKRPGPKPVRPYLYQYRVIKTDMYVSIIMNPRHPTTRSFTADGPNRSLAPLLDAGYMFGPLRELRAQERHSWAMDRLPDGIEIFGFRNIDSTPTS